MEFRIAAVGGVMGHPSATGVTISKEYRWLNTRLHEKTPYYGTSAQIYAKQVVRLAAKLDTRDILDYGCGKGTLQKTIGIPMQNFDPCVIEFAKPPKPADIVACIEVLEHIEPDYLDAVLDDLKRLTRRALFATVATGPSTKLLRDGRNAHLIQGPEEWWLDKIGARLLVEDVERHEYGFIFTAVPIRE